MTSFTTSANEPQNITLYHLLWIINTPDAILRCSSFSVCLSDENDMRPRQHPISSVTDAYSTTRRKRNQRASDKRKRTLNQTDMFAGALAIKKKSTCQASPPPLWSSSDSDSSTSAWLPYSRCNGGPNSNLPSSTWFHPIPRPVPDCHILDAKLCHFEGLQWSSPAKSQRRALAFWGSPWYLRTTPFSDGATASSRDSGLPSIWTWDTLRKRKYHSPYVWNKWSQTKLSVTHQI